MRSHDLGPDPREFYNWGGYQQTAAGDCLGFGPPSEVTFANETGAPCSYVVVLARS